MKTIMYETDRLYVRPLTEEDVRTNHEYQAAFYNQTVTRFNSHGLFPYTRSQMVEFIQRVNSGTEIIWAVITKTDPNSERFLDDEKHIGNISLQRIDWINRSAELACLFWDKEYWGKGYGTESCKLLFKHGFEKLNLNRIWTGTAETNTGMRHIAEKLGMRQEGIFRNTVYLEGQYVNVVEYGILKEEWNHSIQNIKPSIEPIFTNEDKIDIINEIEKARSKNNINWMNLVRLAFRLAPQEARQIIKNINASDKQISELTSKL